MPSRTYRTVEPIAEIEVQGKVIRFDGLTWRAADSELQQLCNLTMEALPFAYRPSPIADVANEVAAALGGRVLSFPAPNPDASPTGDDIVF